MRVSLIENVGRPCGRGLPASNRKARYYSLTSAGRAHLRAETTQRVLYAEAVTGILTQPARE